MSSTVAIGLVFLVLQGFRVQRPLEDPDPF